jgi:pyruvate dehydrogenase E2 component (dihydrolipoamide acetyltransferase)
VGDFLMPSLGADMDAGTILEWRVHPGDAVHRGDIVAVVDTEKSDIEVEVFEEGIIEELLVDVGREVAVGTPLARIASTSAGPEQPAVATATPTRTRRPTPGKDRVSTRRRRHSPEAADHVRASPLARRQAAESGIDLATVTGSGPGGAVLAADMLRGPRTPSTPRPPEPAAQDRADRQANMRRAIGDLMARSKREIPHYYLSTTVDMRRAMTWLAEENLKRPVPERLLYGVLLIKAVALALREVPELNAVWRGAEVVRSEAVHVGVAIALLGGGVVAPALHDTDRQSLGELMRNFRDLVRRARAGEFRSSELSDPTITVTSLGEQGGEMVLGVIYPPQVAIAGFGKIVERPWVVEGAIVPRPVVTATVSADHRVSDGHRGGLFLAAVDRLLQEPARL